MDSAAFFTYIVKFSDIRLGSFMVYTYNIQGRQDRTRCWQTTLVEGILKNIPVLRIFEVTNPLRIR